MEYLIIYHKEDNDGLFSMAIIYNYLIHELNVDKNNICIFGADYNNIDKIELESFEGTTVIITDISFKSNKMKEIYKTYGNNILWFDHHYPIFKESFNNGFDEIIGLRDINNSALKNVYTYFYNQFNEEEYKIPEILNILSAWDSFTYKREGYELDYVRNINVGTTNKYKLYHIDIINLVEKILYTNTKEENNDLINELYEYGKIINESKDFENKFLIDNYGDFEWEVNGRKSCVLFTQGPSNSLMFKSVQDNILNGIVFKRNPDSTYTVSIYNTNTEYDKDFHVGDYLKEHYKGGGHAGAGGCTISESKFIKLLKEKKL